MTDIVAVNQAVYKVVRLLGHGKGGYSYLVEKDGCLYVLKQIHHEPCSYYSFGNKIQAEINDYHRLLQTGIRLPPFFLENKGIKRCGENRKIFPTFSPHLTNLSKLK